MRDNPFKSLRISLGLSQKEIADQIGITSQVVLRNEQGLYTTPNVQIMTVLLREAHSRGIIKHTYHSLTEAYDTWVKDVRHTNGYIFNRPITFKLGHRPVAHPFRIWRESFGFSRIGFCKLLALHPSIVQSYEEGRTGPLPDVIRAALIDAGCSGIISSLQSRCEAYASYMNYSIGIPAEYVRDSDLQEAG